MKTKILIIAPRHYIDELKSYYVCPEHVDIHFQYEELLMASDLNVATQRLLSHGYQGFIGLVDWASLLAAYLNRQIGAPAPNPDVLATLQDKLLSRKLQAKCVKYRGLAVDSAQLKGVSSSHFPLFMKPRRGSMSFLAQEVSNVTEAYSLLGPQVIHELKQQNTTWAKLYEFLNLPDMHTQGLNSFVLESLLPSGIQVTLDGYVQNKRVRFFGFTKSVFYPNHVSFKRFDYPCEMPRRLGRSIQRHARQFVKKSGFSSSLFNIEYKVDVDNKRFALIEINTRPSSQFMYPIQCVTGVHPLDVAIDIVLGRKPKHRELKTNHEMVSVCVLRCRNDALVKRLPTKQDMQWFYSQNPYGRWNAFALPGEKLSAHPNDSRSYRYAELVVLHPNKINVHDYEDGFKSRFDEAIKLESVE